MVVPFSSTSYDECGEPHMKRRRLDVQREQTLCAGYGSDPPCALQSLYTSDQQNHGDQCYQWNTSDSTFVSGCSWWQESVMFPEGNRISGEMVCFGMLTELRTRSFLQRNIPPESASIPCSVDYDGNIFSTYDGSCLGRLEDYASEVLCVLAGEAGISLQLTASLGTGGKDPKRRTNQPVATISAIIYGPRELFEDIGNFAQECELYLQDPSNCIWNVPYQNPHRLTRDGDPPMTFDLAKTSTGNVPGQYKNAFDFFADLQSAEPVEQTKMPTALATPLHEHQRRALTFLLRRESGWNFLKVYNDIWALEQTTSGSKVFLNRVSGNLQYEVPAEFRGGILADEMGLGKTLTMIALLVSDEDPELRQTSKDLTSCCSSDTYVDSTLVVVPSQLLQVWDFQLHQHLKAGQIKWIKYHGERRSDTLCELERFNVILTTYQTLVSERSRGKHTSSPIFSAHWRRIVLDEAHCIKDRTTLTAKAIFSLAADRRWAVTGTPVQNRLTDFASLLEFLHVYPYDNPRTFDADISSPWKEGDGAKAVDRLKSLASCIILRRLKTTIKLPDRKDTVEYVDFDQEEQLCYEEAESPVIQMLDNALGEHGASGKLLLSALQRINALRMICDLGMSASVQWARQPSPLAPLSPANSVPSQECFNALLGVDEVNSCCNCSLPVDDIRDGLATASTLYREFLSPAPMKSAAVLCAGCSLKYRGLSAPTTPENPIFSPLSRDNAARSSTPACSTPHAMLQEQLPGISSKVRALVHDLQLHPDDKCVVFSCWTTSLDMVKRALDWVQIGSVQFDGRISAANREIALQKLRDDPYIRVMLITTSCGAVGLDLTAASRAYLLEPQWNPTTEEQALARVHRMGQKRSVTTIRFIMRGSFEEHVIKVQNRKRQLADLLLSGGKASESDGTQVQLQHLRSLLGR